MLTARAPGRRLASVLAAAAATLATLATMVPAAAAAGPEPPEPPFGPTTSTTSTTLVPLSTTPPPTVAPPTTVAAASSGRQWIVPVPTGCDVPTLPDVVFVGTIVATDFRTARFQVDQVRAGAIERYSFDGVVDVRYGIDTKFLEIGGQYLVGASLDPSTSVLASRVTAPEPLFGGDEVIGASESDVECPALDDPVRTLHTDGTPVDSGVLAPLADSRSDVLRSVLLPAAAALGIIFVLVALRWGITGIGRGIAALFGTLREPREVRAVMRTNLRSRQPD